MRYLIAMLLPPLAVIMCGKPGQLLMNILCCLFCWLPGIIHALLVVNNTINEENLRRTLRR